MKTQNRSPDPTPLLIGFALLLIGVAQITVLWTLARGVLVPVMKSFSLVEVYPATLTPQIYRLKILDHQIQLSPETVNFTVNSPEAALDLALKELLARSPAVDPTTTIPEGTRLLDLHLDREGIHINLSEEFAGGGGSSSMIYRVAQVLYTATSIAPQAPVFFSVEAIPLNEDYPLGGEGLLLEYPLTRQQFERDFLAN